VRVLTHDAAVVLALGEGPSSGVGIMDRLRSAGPGSPDPRAGTLYPLLGQLEKEGLVRSWVERERFGVGRPRRFVELTTRGLVELDRVGEQLRRFAARPPRPAPPMTGSRMRTNLRRAFRVSTFARRLRDAVGER